MILVNLKIKKIIKKIGVKSHLPCETGHKTGCKNYSKQNF